VTATDVHPATAAALSPLRMIAVGAPALASVHPLSAASTGRAATDSDQKSAAGDSKSLPSASAPSPSPTPPSEPKQDAAAKPSAAVDSKPLLSTALPSSSVTTPSEVNRDAVAKPGAAPSSVLPTGAPPEPAQRLRSGDAPASKPEQTASASRSAALPQPEAKSQRSESLADAGQRGRWKLLAALVAGPAIVVLGGWMVTQLGQVQPTKPGTTALPTRPDRPATVLSELPAAPSLASQATLPPAGDGARASPTASAPGGPSDTAPNADAPLPAALTSAAPNDSSANAGPGEVVSVQIRIRPEGTSLYRKGRKVGTSPFTLEIPRGERRAFEVGYPGYYTRKLIVDGTQPVIEFGLIRVTQ
jgi:hypothetical protein